MAKVVYIGSTHRNHTTIYEGTVTYLVERVFGYDLECGHSWNNKIPRKPRTASSLVKALNKSADECRRYSDYYEEFADKAAAEKAVSEHPESFKLELETE